MRHVLSLAPALDLLIAIMQVNKAGEAAGNLPDQFQKTAPEIDLRKIKGLRNILIHEYFGINLPIIWDVVQSKLGPLETVCRKLVEKATEADDKEVV